MECMQTISRTSFRKLLGNLTPELGFVVLACSVTKLFRDELDAFREALHDFDDMSSPVGIYDRLDTGVTKLVLTRTGRLLRNN